MVTEITEILETMIPVFVTAIVCPSLCLMTYYMYKARLSFGTRIKPNTNTKNSNKRKRNRN